MNPRNQLEKALIDFCNSQVPKIPFSVEGVGFTKPSSGPYVQCWLLGKQKENATVSAERQRVNGIFQINVCSPSGVGTKKLEDLVAQVAALYPVAPKELFTDLSIEQPANESQVMIDGNFLVQALTIRYRQETSY